VLEDSDSYWKPRTPCATIVHPVGDGFGSAHEAYLPDSSGPTGNTDYLGAEFRQRPRARTSVPRARHDGNRAPEFRNHIRFRGPRTASTGTRNLEAWRRFPSASIRQTFRGAAITEFIPVTANRAIRYSSGESMTFCGVFTPRRPERRPSRCRLRGPGTNARTTAGACRQGSASGSSGSKCE
jgi:hypothetical protein